MIQSLREDLAPSQRKAPEWQYITEEDLSNRSKVQQQKQTQRYCLLVASVDSQLHVDVKHFF